MTFDVWFKRFETVFTNDADEFGLKSTDKVKLLVRKLSTAVFNRLADHTAPSRPEDKSFEDCKGFLMKTLATKKHCFRRGTDV